MSTLELPTVAPLEQFAPAAVPRAQRLFAVASIVVLLAVDVCVVSASFLTSYLVQIGRAHV